MKRLNLKLTDEEHKRLKKVAKSHNKSMTQLMRIYLRIGLITDRKETDLIIREHNKETYIIVL